MFKRFITLLSVIALFGCEPLTVSAEAEEFAPPAAASYCLYEARSGTVIAESSDESRPAGHLAKLMTVLICAEECESGELSMSQTVKTSANANSKQGAQIWLDAGEEVSVEELMKSIIIGNANDACCALAEYISGSEGDHVTRMNARADRLGMKNTRFSDALGESEDTVTTAHDIALLTAELSRHPELDELFTTRIDTVRGGRAELVSNNRLILSYKGIRGTKACGGESSGECIAACADKNGMTLCAVILGASDPESKLADARRLLDHGAENYRLFVPEVEKKYLKSMTVSGGCAPRVELSAELPAPALIEAGTAGEITSQADVPDFAAAPVKKGSTLGRVDYYRGDELLMTADIVAAESVDSMDMVFAIKRTLLNLLDLSV